MTSVVYWAVLGLVIERPSYGMELFTRYQRLYADLLPVSGSSHIYTALDELEGRAFIETTPEVGTGRQPKPHYRATPLGTSSFENWYVEQMDAQRRGLELWARQLAIFAHDPVAAVGLIDRFRREYLDKAGKIGGGSKNSVSNSRGALIDELVAEQQRIAAGGMLSWLRFAKARFEDRARSVTNDGSP
ncbi:MAG TPA: helix-turn-helix transcriptional regulator [Solirubrobacteraceae bacterium]|jgi:DNA-binding PadR family transcriptional regulator|nr:helix-turn-helix transcriptional regulator [Solirubrobacteraceae bacterium]